MEDLAVDDASQRSSFEPTYLRRRLQFQAFEVSCFGALCEFVRVHLDDLLDEYYCEGCGSFDAFPGWAFERYLRDVGPQ